MYDQIVNADPPNTTETERTFCILIQIPTIEQEYKQTENEKIRNAKMCASLFNVDYIILLEETTKNVSIQKLD